MNHTLPPMQDAIQEWFHALIEDLPMPEVAPDFGMEDGMPVGEYWEHECHNFRSLKAIFDLASPCEVRVVHQHALTPHDCSQEKIYCIVYLFNPMGRLVCKSNLTLSHTQNEKKWKVSSNGFRVQVVPKVVIKDMANNRVLPKCMGLALRSHEEVLRVWSHQMETQSLHQSADGYYSVRLQASPGLETMSDLVRLLHPVENLTALLPGTALNPSKATIHLQPVQRVQPVHDDEINRASPLWHASGQVADIWLYTGTPGCVHKEKRQVFFDEARLELKPYQIDLPSGCLHVVNDVYPVHLAAFSSHKPSQSWSHPRHVSLSLHEWDSLVVTDCLDHDWEIDCMSYRANAA